VQYEFKRRESVIEPVFVRFGIERRDSKYLKAFMKSIKLVPVRIGEDIVLKASIGLITGLIGLAELTKTLLNSERTSSSMVDAVPARRVILNRLRRCCS